ncbi:MAG: Y-family DNA polymerase [Rhodospirillaceae bacterium]
MFVSCERVFNPILEKFPVVVLSSNDGCAIARSNEVKALGIKMGDPYFKISNICEKNGVVVMSSNFSLYCDMSMRFMSCLSENAPAVEQYSIDEMFVDLSGLSGDLGKSCHVLRKTVKKWTGLPVSFGTGPTKTLAKLANRLAKKSAAADGVIDLTGHPGWVERALAKTAVQDVWGIGKASAEKLNAIGISDALALRGLDDRRVRQLLGIGGLKTVQELRGVSCHTLETIPDTRQSCMVSRSFGEPTANIDDIRDAITLFANRASEKLRNEGLVAGNLTVFADTNRFRRDLPQRHLSVSARLYPPTSDGLKIVKAAARTLERGWEEGPWLYVKAGVMMSDIVGAGAVPADLFTLTEKPSTLMAAVDRLNQRYGRETVSLGLHLKEATWRSRAERLSPDYTGCWSDIPVALSRAG